MQLLLNATQQDDNAIDGLGYVQDLLSRYHIIQKILMEDSNLSSSRFADQRQIMRAAVITLYYRTLEYQFSMIRQFSRSKVSRVLHNMFGPVVRDDCKGKLTTVKETEKTTEGHRQVRIFDCEYPIDAIR